MNTQAIGILFLKDLYLSRRPLFWYFAAGLLCSVMNVIPNPTLSFVGFVMILTVAIGSGMHLLGELLLSEGSEQTRTFILSLPVSRTRSRWSPGISLTWLVGIGDTSWYETTRSSDHP